MVITQLFTKSQPRLIYTTKAYCKLLNLLNTKHAQTLEFGFMGEITKNENDYIVEDLHLMPQITESAYWESDDDKYPEWLNETFPNPLDRKKLRLQGHSHVNMSTFASGKDQEQIMTMINGVKDYFIQLIVNLKLTENLVNIYSRTENLIYSKVPEFVKIGNTLIPLDKAPKINVKDMLDNLKLSYLEDLKIIHLTDDVYFDIQELSVIIADEILFYNNNTKKINMFSSSIKDMNLEISKYCVKRTIKQTEKLNPFKNDDNESPYTYKELEDYYNKWYGEQCLKPKKGKGRY